MGESLLNNNQRENKNFSNRLTSIDKEIHSLAENILGPQYAKYLK
jgi:hypothetical protein